jgi:tetratricopeptide (TPR) repeat protein
MPPAFLTIRTVLRWLFQRQCLGCLVLALATWSSAPAQTVDPLAGLQAASDAAEAALRDDEVQIADSRYRETLREGWLVIGGLDAAERRWADAATAFERAASATVHPRQGLLSLALVHIQTGRVQEAVQILTRLVARDKSDIASRRLLAQALAASGQLAEAVQELEEAAATAPTDDELKFVLASGYLQMKKVEAADRLFGEIASSRPIPQTHVLIGRTYRDSGEYDHAREALHKALEMDPRTTRAHYYLGTTALLQDGVLRLEYAIDEFRQELRLAPADPVTNLRLGIALVEARHTADALDPLQMATASASAPPDAWFYLGRCLLALDRAPEAVTALERALQLAQATTAGELRIGSIENQLGLALRKTGAEQEAAAHFAEAERLSAQHTEQSRSQLARYLADAPDPATLDARPPIDTVFPFATLPEDQRRELRRRTATALARAYFNMGVLHARADRPARAAELLQSAATLDPAFPQIDASLGSTYFKAQQYEKAVEPLARASAASPSDASVRRMLAMSLLSAGAAERAVEVLRNDPGRDADPALQYAFGLALLRANRSAQAQLIFSRLIAEQGNTPELNVVMGQAQAQQGDYDGAISSLQRAIALKADVPEAHAALGVIYLKQGKLPEAAASLRKEIDISPGDFASRSNLATVLQLQGEHDEPVALLRGVLKVRPEFADARYLLGKILLADGAAEEAVQHLEVAARVAPQDFNIHYQLGQAYQKLGRSDLAQREFDLFRELKDKLAGRTP